MAQGMVHKYSTIHVVFVFLLVVDVRNTGYAIMTDG